MTDPIASLNTALEGRYAIERELGQGGMATVYLADDLKHDRKVALKVLKPELAAVVGADRFLAEIKTTANLQHPHILPLFDSGEADTFLYYVMPYVEGETLRDKIDREKQLPVKEAVGIAINMAHALQVAHDAGVIHRDIKPGNILLSRGEPLVADFGIALAVGAASGTRLTETGLSIGTPYYMSPEQATGDQMVGAASDTFSVACVLYEMLTGDPPYSGSTAQAVLGKIIQGVAVSSTAVRKSVPANVDAAIRKALEKLPADRFTSAQAFSDALSDPGYRYGEGSPTGDGAQAVRWKRTAAAFAALFAIASAVAVWAVTKPVPTPARPVERFAQPFSENQMPAGGIFPGLALSPDGSSLVYSSRGGRAGTTEFFLRRWEDLESTPVNAPPGALFPTFSPDGQSIAYAVQGRGIEVVSLQAQAARTVAEVATPYVHWGSDDYIYFVNDLGGAVRRPSTGGTIESLTETGEGEAFHPVSDVIRDGQVVLFTALPGLVPRGEMRTLDLETRETTVIGPGFIPHYANSGHLVYLRADSTLMAASFNPNDLSMSGAPVPMLEGVTWFTTSESGKLFYQRSMVPGGGLLEFVWVTRNGVVTPVDPGWSFRDSGANRGWSLSPDGSRLAFRTLENANYDIWTKELDDGPRSRLTFSEAQERKPTWTPDGQRVTFLSNRLGDYAAFSKAANGTGATELIFDGETPIGQAFWGPDGESLIFRTFSPVTTGSGARDIFSVRPGTDTVPRRLLTEAYEEASPSLSSDGRWLAYVSNETGAAEVYVRPFPAVDGGKWQVSTNGGMGPRWSNDGRELFFQNGDSEFVAAQIDTRNGFTVLERVTLFQMPAGFLPSVLTTTAYDVTADGQRFIMVREYNPSGLAQIRDGWVLVDNWFEELKARVGS